MGEYLLAGQASEVSRLQLQSRVWEPAGERLLAQIGDGTGQRVLDVGCGCLGWLRILSRWAPDAQVVGTDLDPRMIDLARQFVTAEELANVELVVDDLFASALPAASFDLVHARFQLAPIGRAEEQIRAYLRLLRPGGRIVIEDPDAASWRYNPPAPALAELVELILQAFRHGGGDFNVAGRYPACCALTVWYPRSGHRSWPLPPDTRTCACPCSSPPLCSPACSPSSARTRLTGCGNARRPNSTTPTGGPDLHPHPNLGNHRTRGLRRRPTPTTPMTSTDTERRPTR